MFRKFLLCSVVCVPLALAGCSGDHSPVSGGGSVSAGSGLAPQNVVAGPLNTVQSGLGGLVNNLSQTAANSNAPGGQALAGLLDSVNQMVNGNVLSILNALTSASNAANSGTGVPGATDANAVTAQQIAAQFAALTANLQSLITSLAPAGATGANPLAGTPLAALGALLPQLQSLQGQANAIPGLPGGGSAQLTQLAGLFGQLQSALQGVNNQLPAQVLDSPVLGGLLQALPGLLGNIGGTPTDTGSGVPTNNLINTLVTDPKGAAVPIANLTRDLITKLVSPLTVGSSGLNGILLPISSSGPSQPGNTTNTNLQQQIQSTIAELQSIAGGKTPMQQIPATLISALLVGPGTAGMQQLLAPLTNALLGASTGPGSGSPANPLQGLLGSSPGLLGGLLGALSTLLGGSPINGAGVP